MKYIKYTLGLALVLTLQANAQGVSPAAMEQLKMQRLWLNSQNAAGMVFDDATNFSNLHVDYNQENGNFHRPQEGEKTTGIGVSSEGFMKMKNALVWGAFSFMQRNLTDAGYNASITDPFRGMPYYIIDEHLSNWRNQHYDLRFRASTPLINNRWAFGLEGIYQASLAAKQRDPRVDTRFYTLKVVPGVTYQMNGHNRLGLSLRYESIKEDSRMENENSDIDQNYYILYGLGTAVKASVADVQAIIMATVSVVLCNIISNHLPGTCWWKEAMTCGPRTWNRAIPRPRKTPVLRTRLSNSRLQPIIKERSIRNS